MNTAKPRTYNYTNCTENLKTQELARIAADVTIQPLTLVERCGLLMWDFLERYINSGEGLKNLALEAEHRPELIRALLNSIHEQMCIAEDMLEEIQDFEDYPKERG